ncbi:MAG: CAP domain-containing protein [Planctomycetota bacterium]|nr:MAG: CAP domain-containing protein [Planctomycetota bacterium]
MIRTAQFALCGMLFLAGCTGTVDLGDSSAVAGLMVDGVQTGTSTCNLPSNKDMVVSRLVELINRERTSRGLHTLTLDSVLNEVADAYCCEMIGNDYFDHINPFTHEGPGERAIHGGYLFVAIGENLAGGQHTPEQVVIDWMNSTKGHRENILAAQWEELGVGVRTGGDYGVYWVVEFGNPP